MTEHNEMVEKVAQAIEVSYVCNSFGPHLFERLATAALQSCNYAGLVAEVEALKHDLERQMTIAHVECNEAERLRTENARLREAVQTTAERLSIEAQIAAPTISEEGRLRAKMGHSASNLFAALQPSDTAQEE